MLGFRGKSDGEDGIGCARLRARRPNADRHCLFPSRLTEQVLIPSGESISFLPTCPHASRPAGYKSGGEDGIRTHDLNTDFTCRYFLGKSLI